MADVPILKATPLNPRSVIPGPMQTSDQNYFDVGRREAKAEQRLDKQGARLDFDFEQQQLKAERAPYEEMMKNPEMADYVAQQYGIKIDDNIRQALRKPMEFDRLLKGGQAAKAYGITNPQAASRFAAEFLATGDLNAARQSVQGMPIAKPGRHSYSHLERMKPGEGLYDQRTGKWLVNPDAMAGMMANPRDLMMYNAIAKSQGFAPIDPSKYGYSGASIPSVSPATQPSALPPEKKALFDSLFE